MPKIRELIPEEKVNQRIAEMGEQISRDYEGKEIHLIAILKGSVFRSRPPFSFGKSP